jgi:hypothetical protein
MSNIDEQDLTEQAILMRKYAMKGESLLLRDISKKVIKAPSSAYQSLFLISVYVDAYLTYDGELPEPQSFPDPKNPANKLTERVHVLSYHQAISVMFYLLNIDEWQPNPGWKFTKEEMYVQFNDTHEQLMEQQAYVLRG